MATIYVMGPYTAETWDGKLRNTQRAMDVGVALIQKGHTPFIPHLTHYLDERAKQHGIELPNTFWYHYDFHWMPLCAAGFWIASSPGADQERAIMEQLGRPIYTDLNQVPDINPLWRKCVYCGRQFDEKVAGFGAVCSLEHGRLLKEALEKGQA